MKFILKGICIAAVITLAIFGFSYVTMLLWNRLMPVIFGLTIITYWQALGLLVLGKILFSGFGGKGGRGHCGCGHRGWKGHHRGGMWKKRWEDKMANMSPEEREKFKKGWGNCGWDDDTCEMDSKADSNNPKT
ncbi:MAG: hypothetical protein M3R17_09290 [Bacteroidota bacterium]|nr:hypothetical protein [Bacteroidota bacterium]